MSRKPSDKADHKTTDDNSMKWFEQFQGTIADRRTVSGRRSDSKDTGLERRRGPGRRRADFTKAAEEGEMTNEQFLFLMAIDAFKRVNDRTFPTWTDVLEIVRRLGYRKVQESQINLPNSEDWVERPDAPACIKSSDSDEDTELEDLEAAA